MLSSGPTGTRRESAEPGTARLSQPHMADTVEHLLVSAGRVAAGPADSPVELGPGDYTRYPGDVPHVFRALKPGTWGTMILEHAAANGA
jgi:hypothetical protein